MKKLLIFCLLLLSIYANAQTTKTPYARLSGDYIRPQGSFEHWGTSNWGEFNATPTIPSGNTKPLDFYTRFNWVDIENTNTAGSYSWTIFDAFVNQAIDSGAKFHFGIMDMCSACGLPNFGYPTYLHNLMQAETANSRDWQDADGVWVPNWNSPNFISHYASLQRAVMNHINTTGHAGKTYASAFSGYDIRFLGDFGEGHFYPFGTAFPTGRTPTSASLITLLDTVMAIFPNVQLTTPMSYFDPTTPMSAHYTALPLDFCFLMLDTTNSVGQIGWRRDNVGDDGYNAYLTGNPGVYNGVQFTTLILNKWKFAPIGGEPANDLNGTSRCGTVQCDLANEINTFHLSHIGNGNYPVPINDPTWGANMVTNVRNGNAIMGNKIVVDTSQTTTNPSTGGTWNISLWWKNLNVSPIYESTWKPIFELRNGATVVWRDTSRFKLRFFLPQTTDSIFNDNFLLTGVSAGTYSLYLIIKDSTGYRAPYPLANTGRQADGSYLLRSNIVVSTSTVPTANAGPDQSITLPTNSTTLDGSLSSGSLTSFFWTVISGPNSPAITDQTQETTTVGGLIQGVYVFRLAVNGGTSGSLVDSMTVTVNPAPPAVANAGPDQNINAPTTVASLSGSASTGTITSYSWTQVSGPNTATISTPTSVATNVSNLIVGTYNFKLSINGGSSTDQVLVVVNPQPAFTTTIFTTQVPLAAGGPDAPVELGMKFSSTLSGYIRGIRFYKTSVYTGTHIGELYTLSGTRLAQATFTNETATGWQTVYFSQPVAITAGVTYVAAYYNASGIYTDDNTGTGGTTLATSITNSPLTALADGASGANGVYSYSATPTFPTSTFKSSNYWVDVVFSSARSFVIGNGSGSVSLTSMTNHFVGDTAYIATQSGTYTSLTLKNLNGIVVRPQSGRPVFTTQSTFCNLNGVDVGYINFVSAGNTTAIDATCGRIDSSYFHNLYFQDWGSYGFNASGNMAYTYNVDSTYKWLRNKFDSLKFYHMGRPFQGAFGVSPITTDIMRRDTFRNIVIEATTTTSFEGIAFTGVCYGCIWESSKYTSTTGRGSSGDDGLVSGAGWWIYRNNYQNGSPNYSMRLFPMMELNDTGSTQFYNNAKLNGTEYGMVNLQINLGDTIAGQRRGNSAYLYNNTMGNQFNDTLGYWSTMFNLGQVPPNCHYYVKNNFGFNIGNNPQRQSANGQPNNGKPPIAVNLGGWNTIGGDTSNNQYYIYGTVAKIDSVSTLFSNSLGAFKGYYLTSISPGRLLNGGVTNFMTSTDYLGNPYRVPPDLGYIQFFGNIAPPSPCGGCLPGLRKGNIKNLITVP